MDAAGGLWANIRASVLDLCTSVAGTGTAAAVDGEGDGAAGVVGDADCGHGSDQRQFGSYWKAKLGSHKIASLR